MNDLTRAFAPDLMIRADAEGRTVAGIVVPYGRAARVSDGGPAYDEMFQMGAFGKSIRERGSQVKLLMHHNSREPIGKALELREDAAGLYGEFRVSAVPAGDQALELVRDGVIDSFSVGFSPLKSVERDGVTVRTEAALREASLVTFPAYSDARITALREVLRDLPEQEREALIREWAAVPDLSQPTTDTTPDGEPDRSADEPVDDHSARRHNRQRQLALVARAQSKGLTR